MLHSSPTRARPDCVFEDRPNYSVEIWTITIYFLVGGTFITAYPAASRTRKREPARREGTSGREKMGRAVPRRRKMGKTRATSHLRRLDRLARVQSTPSDLYFQRSAPINSTGQVLQFPRKRDNAGPARAMLRYNGV